MKRILLIIALLFSVATAQTRYSWPLSVESSSGRPLNAQTVAIFDTTGTLYKNLVYETGSPGRYYSTTAIANGVYTLKLYSGGVWRTVPGHERINIEIYGLDQLRAIVSDSLAALSADGVTIINSGTLKQKVFADISTLNAASADTLFTKAWLRGLNASTNPNRGSGDVVYADSTTLRSLYGAGIDLTGVSYKSSTAGKRWYRLDALSKEKAVQATWFGVVADGSTDDVTAIDAAETAARSLDRNLELPAGVIRLANKWQIANTSQDEGIQILGQGSAKTYLLLGSGAKIEIGNGGAPRTRNVLLSGFTVLSEAAKQDTAIFMNSVGNCKVFDVRVGANGGNNFFWSLVGYRTEHTIFENFDALYNYNGLKIVTNANGNMLLSCDIGQMDSICVQFDNGSHGNGIKGGEFGNSPLGILATDISEVSIEDVNLEGLDSAAIVLGNESEISINNFSMDNTGHNGWLAIVSSARLNLGNYAVRGYGRSGGEYFKRTSGSAHINDRSTKRERANGGVNFNATDLGSPEFKYPVRFYNIYADNTGSLGSTNYDENRGFLWGKFTRTGISGADSWNWIGKTDSGYVNYNLVANAKVFNRANGGYSEPVMQEIYTGYENVTTDATGDSTEVTIDTDAAGIVSFYDFGAPVVYRNGGGIFKLDGYCVKSFDATTGQVVYVIWHERAADKNASVRVYATLRIKD